MRASAVSQLLPLVRRAGDAGRAIELARETLAARDPDAEADPQVTFGRAWLGVELADALVHAGEWREALAVLESIHDAGDLIRCRAAGIRGQAYLHLGLPDVAAPHIEEQLEIATRFKEAGDPFGEALHQEAVVRDLNLWLASERFDRVVERAARWLQPESYGSMVPSMRAQILLRQGLALAELARRDRSKAPRAEEVLAEAVRALSPHEGGSGRLALVELALAGGDEDTARALLEELRAWLVGDGPTRRTGMRVQWNAYRAALAAELALRAGDEELVSSAERDLRQAYDELLVEWERSGWREEGVAFLHFGARCFVVSQLMRLVDRPHVGGSGADAAFDVLLRAQELSTVTRSRKARATDIARVRDALAAPGRAILSFLLAPDRVHLFVIDEEPTLHATWEVESRAFYGAVRDFRASVNRSPRSEPSDEARRRRRDRVDELGRELVDRLLPDAIRERLTRAREWTVVGIDMLAYLPVEALPWRGSRIGRELAIAYLPSVPFGVALAAEPFDLRRDDVDRVEIATAGAPTRSASVPSDLRSQAPLSMTDRELLRITPWYPTQRKVARTTDQATWGALRGMLERSPTVLQVWTHGVFAPARERPSGLVFAAEPGREDGMVWYDDILAIDSPPVVVLAACGAASGPVRRGEDLVSRLDAAFLRRGGRVVVLPSADAEVEATARLLETFHARLRGHGESPAEAMRAARAALSSDERYEDPFYDALIHVVGAGHDPVFEPGGDPPSRRGSSSVAALVACVAVVAVAVAWILRRGRFGRR